MKQGIRSMTDASRLSVAPMMDWTDRHCRHFHRRLTRQALLYTEMVTAPALVRGGATHLLDFSPAEHPVACQLGGSEPAELAEAAAMVAEAGYDEVNLNVGCPSDRVQSGCFGAVLMETPDLVAACVRAMMNAQPLPVTVKCRIGVDDQDPAEVLPDFIARIRDAGVTRVAVHARKAWLEGLSPKENRDVPPLDHDLVLAMKHRFPDLHISVNGGIGSLDEAEAFLARGFDGVMIGRAAYSDPFGLLAEADARIFGDPRPTLSARRWRWPCAPTSPLISRRAGGFTRSPATCWGSLRGSRARGSGGGSSRTVRTGPAPGSIFLTMRSRRSARRRLDESFRLAGSPGLAPSLDAAGAPAGAALEDPDRALVTVRKPRGSPVRRVWRTRHSGLRCPLRSYPSPPP